MLSFSTHLRGPVPLEGSRPGDEIRFIRDFDGVLNALFALLIVVGAVIAALPPLRRLLDHDRWHLAHASLYLAVLLAFGHQVKRADLARGWPFVYWCALTASVIGLVIFYRFLRPFISLARYRFAVVRVVPESADAFSVEISGRGLERFCYRAGQFANWSFFARGLGAPHPFSFSKAPRGTTLRITVKVCGDYTARLRAVRPGTKVMIDGPLGGFIEHPESGAKYLLVAGGIGVTPLRALAESLTLSGKDILFFYSAKRPADFVLRKELEALPIQPRLFVTDPRADPEPPISKGRVDAARLESLVGDLREREIYICGPAAMIDALIKDLGGRGVPRRQLHSERFSY